MSKIMDLQVEITVPQKEVSADIRKNLWVLVVNPAQPDKVLGKAKVGGDGIANVKFQVEGRRAPSLKAVLSPLSKLKNLKYVRNESVEISQWSEQKGAFSAKGVINLTDAFTKSVGWLDEEFVVNGLIVNRYTDTQTEVVIETPIRHAFVKLFDVDKNNYVKPGCMPSTISCIPSTISCKPFSSCIPVKLGCAPILTCKPQVACGPTYACVPSVQPQCGPWVEKPFDPEIIQDEMVQFSKSINPAGCCGSNMYESFKSRKIAVPAPVMKPASSPALVAKNAAYIGNTVDGVSECLPASSISTCIPATSTFLSAYKKNQLGSEMESDDLGRFDFSFKRKDFFEASAGSEHIEDTDWDEFPDILFQAKLWLDGEFRLIYDEKYSKTRWNQGNSTFVKLVVNGQLPVGDPGDTDVDLSQDEEFLFHGIGNVEPGWIASDGVIRTAPADTGLNEYVFGAGMDILGQFKIEHSGKYYQVEYQKSGSSDWKPVLGEQWYYSHYLGMGKWETLLNSPESFAGFPACYKIPDYTDITITKKTHLITWSSYRMDGNIPRYANGLYHLRVRLLEKVGTEMQPVEGFDQDANILHVKIDNNWPTAEIQPTLYVGELSGSVLNVSGVSECGLVRRGSNKYLLINFTAEDIEKHFLLYNITVNRGADPAITIPDSGLPATVTTSPSLSDFGVLPAYYVFHNANDNFSNAYCAMNLGVDPWLPLVMGSDGHLVSQQLRPCAYNFTLHVYDRVTNGYGNVHYSQHPMTLTVLE